MDTPRLNMQIIDDLCSELPNLFLATGIPGIKPRVKKLKFQPMVSQYDYLSVASESEQRLIETRAAVEAEKFAKIMAQGLAAECLVEQETKKATEGFKFMTEAAGVENTQATVTQNAVMKNVLPGYDALAWVLAKALDQAQNGKGNQRHQVGDAPFTAQPICSLTRTYGLAYPFGQAAKKTHEVGQLEHKNAKLAEVLGAINYLAAAYIVISENDDHNM